MHLSPQCYYSAIEMIDDVNDCGNVYRPTEISAMMNLSYRNKHKNIQEVMNPQKERSAIKRFHLNVQEIVDILNLDGSLSAMSERGRVVIKNPKLIAIELQNRGYIWIFDSHVREAQNRLLFRSIVNG